jgi:hypothetical protein
MDVSGTRMTGLSQSDTMGNAPECIPADARWEEDYRKKCKHEKAACAAFRFNLHLTRTGAGHSGII